MLPDHRNCFIPTYRIAEPTQLVTANGGQELMAMNFLQRTFQRGPLDDAAQARRDAAYEKGRNDGRANVDERGLISEHDVAVRHAYDRGRRDERARHPRRRRGSPVLTTVLFLAACAGA